MPETREADRVNRKTGDKPIVITGDISHTGTIQSYNLAKRYINKIQSLGGVVIPTMGTKDNRQHLGDFQNPLQCS